jgi:hypothetical protein
MQDERPEIPHELCETFGQALGAYLNWTNNRTRALEVTFNGQSCSVEFACNLVEKFHGTMPDNHYLILCDAAHRTGGSVDRPVDRSYAAGTRCLRSLVEHQRYLDNLRAAARKGLGLAP